jgi:hypothetical protein
VKKYFGYAQYKKGQKRKGAKKKNPEVSGF